MKIGVDVRSLLEPYPSGVVYYTKNLLENLLAIDKVNQYILFYNSWSQKEYPLLQEIKKFPNVQIKKYHYPNKIINGSINFLHYPRIDQLIGGADIFFAPNLQFISLSKKCRKVVTVHDLSFDLYSDFLSLKRKLWHAFINPEKFIKSADRIIADSQNTKQDIISYYKINPEKISVVYLGIDVSKKEEAIPNFVLPKKYFLTISTIEPRKNIGSLIAAFKKIKQRREFQDYYLIIAGARGWKAANTFKAAQGDKNIIFLGHISTEQKTRLIKNAQIFIYPSFYEGFGFPPLEAMTQNIPVISSWHSSLPEILDKAAMYINCYDINEIVQALQQVTQDGNLRQQLIVDGAIQVQKFSWLQTASETLNIFKELV